MVIIPSTLASLASFHVIGVRPVHVQCMTGPKRSAVALDEVKSWYDEQQARAMVAEDTEVPADPVRSSELEKPLSEADLYFVGEDNGKGFLPESAAPRGLGRISTAAEFVRLQFLIMLESMGSRLQVLRLELLQVDFRPMQTLPWAMRRRLDAVGALLGRGTAPVRNLLALMRARLLLLWLELRQLELRSRLVLLISYRRWFLGGFLVGLASGLAAVLVAPTLPPWSVRGAVGDAWRWATNLVLLAWAVAKLSAARLVLKFVGAPSA